MGYIYGGRQTRSHQPLVLAGPVPGRPAEFSHENETECICANLVSFLPLEGFKLLTCGPRRAVSVVGWATEGPRGVVSLKCFKYPRT